MSDLLRRQQHFAQLVALWIRAAYVRGYNVTFGDAFRDFKRASFPYSFPGSFHGQRLAMDMNLFTGDGRYLTTLKEWEDSGLGHLWETMGGTWGGRFSTPDPNHLSLGEGHRMTVGEET